MVNPGINSSRQGRILEGIDICCCCMVGAWLSRGILLLVALTGLGRKGRFLQTVMIKIMQLLESQRVRFKFIK